MRQDNSKEENKAAYLPDKFNLIHNRWSPRSTHYFALFASSLVDNVLLSFQPLLNERDLNIDEEEE